ncbi:hypothetical protein M409DRAFT_63727 [Zasmidium cellare ATCC 36951]|uniref:Uncharacterized protein n=1 Tax=Zasmidium cellare ATCC 36951 TaxID=1080233 RepID=A0A6A6D064_ZASCE|nr:uncharacterized protein M409DRAFT_63727 [Zasmidium cellare ATCC 36951]KAF2171469.1 hypothetical protein M409DRAFT_63727 [Zasmidium cellare ATCC 36951]
MPALVNQTVTIVNKSGKIVSTSKHLVNVFNEAKSAYNERKAEIKATRKKEGEDKENERKARKQLDALNLEDEEDRRSHVSRRSSRHGSDDGRSRRGSDDGRSRSGRPVRRKPVPSRVGERPPVDRGISDSFYANDRPRPHQSSRLRNDVTASMLDDEPRLGELQRRHTDGMQLNRRHNDSRTRRRKSADSIDMDLAYGELPPPLPETRREDELELKSKINYLQRLLDEGNCMQHSVTAIIDNLQKNPDALAAVALTLAEISNIAAKMAPGALAAMKTSFPAVIALLASPQFAIAAGVGVGVTIIAFGGYKIIKKIKAKKDLEEANLLEADPSPQQAPAEEGEEDQLREISRIERWRRGIADEQVNSVGTSVDGEFITPVATRTMIEEGRLTEADLLPIDDGRRSEAGKSKKSKKVKSRKAGSAVSSSGGGKKREKEKEPSVLRSLFKGKRERKREREMAFV